MTRFVWTADIGGTKIAVARVRSDGEITHRFVAPTPAEGGQAVVDALAEQLSRLPSQGVCAIGVGVPGLALPEGAVWAPNIPGWERMPLRAFLYDQFRVSTIVESDRDVFVTGEAWKGAARNCQDVVFLAIGTGIGAGIIAHGQLLRGHAGLSGCLGWMAVRDRFLPGYKSVGCLEYHVAGPGIAREAQRIFRRPLTAHDIVKQARAGDQRAKEILRRAGVMLGLGLANLVDTLNPEMIVVGGGVAAAGNLLLAPARATMLEWAQPLAAKQVRICRSRLGWRASLLGAAKIAFNALGG